jgi:hypothetical protein
MAKPKRKRNFYVVDWIFEHIISVNILAEESI